MGRTYSESDIKLLYGLAAARCSFPDCRIDLTLENKPGEKKQIGKIAHIVAYSDTGPRADACYPREKINSYENLILLCGTHHDVIDTASSRYSVTDLQNMKKQHEAWVEESLVTEVMEVGFAELEVATRAILASTSMVANDSFTVTPPRQKMEKNKLTEAIHHLLIMGLSRSREVGQYIEAQSKLDPGYPERLKAGFKGEYDRLIDEGIYSDALFEAMLTFASGNSGDFKRRAAGLVILSHLFEICEVFEQ
ncbi:Uncharacterised protein [Legionella pneumophila]|uniref:HNH endonuclease signature motif containing protein n=2 Tax=Legionella pneumophila TaxID=446 RepID=UPI0005CB3E6C|nr:HNH endonuclease signature motif containing protein [Legionella pneumophila]HAT8827434.1 HNH endonuclease [Legionella pneumophila subsp. pneumophila]CZH17943.1 Uncharacterised protein [Legionella pneumophila]CZI37543.1 Uncharacterised protein [Legionella pneumophila]HAT4692474.1 HNH endonuclease [Legionella pneumophila]HAT9529652.1 HNH endonuclease [Legionella pneumophila subsp. pneumophila]